MTSSILDGKRKTYRVASPMKSLWYVIGTLVFTLVLLAVVGGQEMNVILPFMAVLFILVVAFAYWLISMTRLEVSSDGITYYSIGYKVHSTWPNIEGYGKRAMGAQDVECLILRESGLEMSWWMRIGQMLQPVGQVAGALQGRYVPGVNMDNYAVWIPISLYAQDWRSGELGEIVIQYAPEAFDNPV